MSRRRLSTVRVEGTVHCTCCMCGKPILGGAHNDPCVGTSKGCAHWDCSRKEHAAKQEAENKHAEEVHRRRSEAGKRAAEKRLYPCSFCGTRFALAEGKAGRCPKCGSIGFNGDI